MNNKKRIIFISVIATLVAIAGLYATYAINVYMEEVTPSEYDMTLNFDLSGNLTKRITIPAGKTKVFDMDITSPYKDSIKYGIAYTLNNPNSLPSEVIIAESSMSKDPTIGILDSGATVSVSIIIVNNSQTDITISLEVINGYKNGGELVLNNNQVLIEEIYEIKIKQNGILLSFELTGTEGENGWYTSDVTVNVIPTVDDGVIISAYEFDLINSEESSTYYESSPPPSFSISEEGKNKLCVIAITTEAKESEFCTNIKIDKTAPTIPTIDYNENYDLVVTGATDNLSSEYELRYQFTGNTLGEESTKKANYEIDDNLTTTGLISTATVKDLAGNSTQTQKTITINNATSGNVEYKNVYVCSLDNKGYSTNDEAVANCQTGESGELAEVTVYQCSVDTSIENTDYNTVAAACKTTEEGEVTEDSTYYPYCDSGFSLSDNDTKCIKEYETTYTEIDSYQCNTNYSYEFGSVTSELLLSPCSTQDSWSCTLEKAGQTFVWCHTEPYSTYLEVTFSSYDECNKATYCIDTGKCTTNSSGQYRCYRYQYEKRSKTCNRIGSGGTYGQPSTSTSGSTCDSGEQVSYSTSGSCPNYAGNSCSSNTSCTVTTNYSCEKEGTMRYNTGYYCSLTGNWTNYYPSCERTINGTTTAITKYQCGIDDKIYNNNNPSNCSTITTGSVTNGEKFYCDVNGVAYDSESTATSNCKSCSVGSLYNGKCYN